MKGKSKQVKEQVREGGWGDGGVHHLMESGLLTKGSYDKSLLTHAGAYQTSGLRTTALLNYYLRSSQMLVWHMACLIHPKPCTVLTNDEKFKRKIKTDIKITLCTCCF